MQKYLFFFLLIAMACSCSKPFSNGTAEFSVSTERLNLNAGDTARFSFTGNPDIITFYSGEPGKRFAYRNRVEAQGQPVVNFSTVRANGTQPNTLQLMISSDFKGVVRGDTPSTKSNIAAAVWTDITSRATLSSNGTAAIPSGNIDLSDFAAAGVPVYFAFKYVAAAGSIQPRWTITNFTIRNVLDDGTSYVIGNMNTSNSPYTNYGVTTYSPGFAAYTLQNNFNWSVSTANLMITGATTAGAATAPAEAWLFIGPVNLRKVTPDIGQVIKSGSQSIADLNFYYRYNTAGNYKATFSGGRVSSEESSLTNHTLNLSVQ